MERFKTLESSGRRILFYERIDSTNIRAKQEAEAGAPSGTVVVADMQTAGRGRRGRTWESPAGSNLYFTLILKPDLAPEKASMLTLVMALAVAEGLENRISKNGDWAGEISCGSDGLVPSTLQIKWPNDIVINGRKVCGILTEMSLLQGMPGKIAHIVIGVGINVKKQEFSPELVDKATDIETECGQRISRKELMQSILEQFDQYYECFVQQGDLSALMERYNSRLVNRDREVRVLDPQGEYTGIATGINAHGELCVTLPDGRETNVYAGEVSVRGIYGYV